MTHDRHTQELMAETSLQFALERLVKNRRVISDLQKARGTQGLFAYEIGVIHAALGELDTAFRLAWTRRIGVLRMDR